MVFRFSDWCFARGAETFQTIQCLDRYYGPDFPIIISCKWCRHLKYIRFRWINCCTKMHALLPGPVLEAVMSKHQPTMSALTSQSASNWNVVLACAYPVPQGILTISNILSISHPVTPNVSVSNHRLVVFVASFIPPPPSWRSKGVSQLHELLSNAAFSFRVIFF